MTLYFLRLLLSVFSKFFINLAKQKENLIEYCFSVKELTKEWYERDVTMGGARVGRALAGGMYRRAEFR